MRFFEPELLNGPSGDPALYVELGGEGRSVLFDCGRLNRLKPARALRISDVFVTHTHIDHFIGFDHLLRILLGSDREIRFWGPPGFIDNVEGKLRGYTWNLVEGQKLVIEALELDGRQIRSRRFRCRDAFNPEGPVETRASDSEGLAFDDGLLEVRFAALDHIIPSLAFSATGKDRHNISVSRLELDGLEPGPWLKGVKEKAASMLCDDEVVDLPKGGITVGEFRKRYVTFSKGEKISYVADCLCSESNLSKILPLVSGSDVLFCEGGFLDCDREKAGEARHLTASQAGGIAGEAGCRRIEIFHFSPKYTDRSEDLWQECCRGFEAGRAGNARNAVM